MIENGYLVSNQKAVDFFKWASKNPTKINENVTKKILKDVKASHLPVFRDGIKVYYGNNFGFGMTKKNIESSLFSSYLDSLDKSISIKQYLRFLNQQKLTNTYHAIPMIKKINTNSLKKAHQLKAKLVSLIPQVKHEKLTHLNNQINLLNKRIKDTKVNISKLEKKVNHWWISKAKHNYLHNIKLGCLSYIKALKGEKLDIKNDISKQLKIFEKLSSDLNHGSKDTLNNKNDPDDLFGGDEAIYLNGKQYSISSFDVHYIDGKVYADLTNVQLETVKKLPNVTLRDTEMNRLTKKNLKDDTDNTFADFDVTFTKPNADLIIKAIYSMIMNLPYIKLDKLPKIDCLQRDLTRDKIFCNTNDGVTLGSNSDVDTSFIDSDIVSDYKNYHQLASKISDKVTVK